MELKALTWGPSDGPIALCLHGFPDTAYGWRKFAPRLAEAGWRVVAPFMRGYAPSSIPSDGSYHIGALMDDALQVRLPGGAQLHIANASQAALAAVLLEQLGRLGAKGC